MPRRPLIAACAVLLGLAGCEGTDVVDPSQSPEGTYTGTWEITVGNATRGLTETGFCPGELTIDVSRDLTVTGSYLLRPAGDCAGGTAVSGAVVNGSYRSSDGGINFGTEVPESDDIIYSDMLENAFQSNLFQGSCPVIDFDEHFVGSWEPSGLRVQGNAAYECNFTDASGAERTETVIVEVAFEGTE